MDREIAKLSQRISRLRTRMAIRSAQAQVLSVGPDFFLEAPFAVRGGENITVGRGFRAMAGLNLFANDGRLVIGDDCSLNTNVYLGASNGSITLGSRVLIGPNVVLRAADHEVVEGEPVISQGHVTGHIVIEDDVWIGANCVITRDVRVQSGSVIGAGSVVTRDIPPGVIVGGVPARLIRPRGHSSR